VKERPPYKTPPEERGPEVMLGEDEPLAERPQKRSFLVDLMLLRLARWLRLLGQDVANPESDSDKALLGQAKRENRILVTRDKRLFSSCSAAGVEGILIRSSRICEQILEMAEKGIALRIDPQRCTLCNSSLKEAEGREGEIWICPNCQRLYWRGGHWKNMEKMLEALRLLKHEREEKKIKRNAR
jgi:uncharacterized protein with PIN domain